MKHARNNSAEARSDRLHHLHNNVVQLAIHEARSLSERTNILLLLNSIFFTGFLLVRTMTENETVWTILVSLLVPILGIAINILTIFVIGRTIAAGDFWRTTAGLIEADDGFWWPKKVEADTDLDFFLARDRAVRGIPTRQSDKPLALGGFRIERIHAATIFGFWLPLLLTVLWLFALAWGIALVAATTADSDISMSEMKYALEASSDRYRSSAVCAGVDHLLHDRLPNARTFY